MREKRIIHFNLTPVSCIILLLAFMAAMPLWSLDPNAPVKRYMVDWWDSDRGFLAEDVDAIAQTPDGYMWFGTHRGLIRYDGIKFEAVYSGNVPSPLDSWISALMVDRAGHLWLGSRGGLTRYENGEFTTYNETEGMDNSMVISLLEDSFGKLWIGTGRHNLKCLSNGKIDSFKEEQGLSAWYIKDILEDQNGVMWIAGHHKGLFRGVNGHFKKFELDVLPANTNYIVNEVMEDRHGVIWVATTAGLIAITDSLSEENRKLRLFTFVDGLSPGGISTLYEDNEDNVWVGTSFGLNRIKRSNNGNWVIDNLLDNTPISCLFEDREGSLWVGTPIFGLKRIRDCSVITFSQREGVPLFHHRLLRTRNGEIWLGSLNGYLYKYQEESKRFQSVQRVWNTRVYITSLGEDHEGNIWIGSQTRGVFMWKGDEFTHYKVGPPDKVIRHVYAAVGDSRHRMWFATCGDGLWCYHDGSIRAFMTEDGLISDRIYNVYEDKKGDLWVGTHSGLNVVENGDFEKKRITLYLPETSISAIYEGADGMMWIGTHGSGLVRLNSGTGEHTFFTPDDGLATNSIIQIMEDSSENFWCSTPNGIFKIARKELEDYSRNKNEKLSCTTFGISDGMKSLFCTFAPNNSIVKGQGNEIWFATKKGVSTVQPQKIRINKAPPMVVIEEVLINGEAIPQSQQGNEHVFRGAKNVRFRFTANTFIAQEKVEMYYRMEGRDKEWTTLRPFQERAAFYEYLPPGSYRFQVTAANSNGIRNPGGAVFRFTLKPYFYQTMLFKILIILLLAAMVLAFNWGFKRYIYLKKLKKKYSNSTLDPEKAEISLRKLLYLMDVKKVYLDEQLTLNALAKKLSIAPRYLSQIINEQLNRNFSEYINGYRIEEAKKVLTHPQKADYSIIDVAYEVGFNTKEVFNRAFKKHTGMTPTQFKKSKK